MTVSVNREGDLYILDIVVPKGIVDREMDDLAKQIQPKVTVKGYRKGQAPLNVVRSQYIDVIKGDISSKLLHSFVSDAMRDNDIKNATNPTLLPEYRTSEKKKFLGKMNLDGSLEFKVSVEAAPEVDVKNYTGIPVPSSTHGFEKWVKEEVYKQQVIFGTKESVERPVENGDEINISFEGLIGTEQFANEDDFTFTVGEGMFIGGFEEAFIGRAAGESFEIEAQFPENYGDPTLDGRLALFKATLHEVIATRPHPVNDEFAAMLSHDSEEDMWNSYKEMWEKEFEQPVRNQVFNTIMDKIIEENPFNVPNGWVENEIKLTLQRLNMKEMPSDVGMLSSLRDISERTVRIAFLLDCIYAKEKDIHLSADEIENLSEGDAKQHGLSGLELLDRLRQSGQYEAYISRHEHQRTIDFLLKSAVQIEEENDNE